MSRARRFLPLAGLVGVLCLWIAIFVAGALTPGYSHLGDAISALGMQGAPAGWILDWLGLPLAGLGFITTGWLVFRDLPRGAAVWMSAVLLVLVGIGALLVGLSPCRAEMAHGFCNPADSPINARHTTGSLMAFFLAPLASLALGARAFRRGADRVLYVFSLAMAVAMLLAHLILRTAVFDPHHLHFGLWQRVLVLAITLWGAGVSLYLARRPVGPGPVKYEGGFPTGPESRVTSTATQLFR